MSTKRTSNERVSSPHKRPKDDDDEYGDYLMSTYDFVLSDVHLHPDHGLVNGRWRTSSFRIQPPIHSLDAIHIRFAMGTVLEQVGAQVWKGAFLLCELLLQLYRTGTICNRGYPCILELGSGTGFCSIFLAKLLQDPTCRIYVTDWDEDVLANCDANLEPNGISESEHGAVLTRRLDWTDPMSIDSKRALSLHEWQDIASNVDFIMAADGTSNVVTEVGIVVYDDQATDALVELLAELLSRRIHGHKHRPYVLLCMEKRINFTLDALDAIAPAYEHFVQCMHAHRLTTHELPLDTIPQIFDYERTAHMVLSLPH